MAVATGKVVSGTFTGTGTSDELPVHGSFTYSLTGAASATVALQRTLDNGTTWGTVESTTGDAEKNGEELTHEVRYRLNCTAYTSGTVTYRLQREF